MESKFFVNDEIGILPEREKIPCFTIILTADQYEIIKNKKPEIYETDGRKYFDMRGPSGGVVSDVALFVIFK